MVIKHEVMEGKYIMMLLSWTKKWIQFISSLHFRDLPSSIIRKSVVLCIIIIILYYRMTSRIIVFHAYTTSACEFFALLIF